MEIEFAFTVSSAKLHADRIYKNFRPSTFCNEFANKEINVSRRSTIPEELAGSNVQQSQMREELSFLICSQVGSVLNVLYYFIIVKAKMEFHLLAIRVCGLNWNL